MANGEASCETRVRPRAVVSMGLGRDSGGRGNLRPDARRKPTGQTALAKAASIITWVPRENSRGQE
jgi:hypothetical protein